MGPLGERAAPLGRTPFTGEATGEDVRYEAEFEALSNEIAKLGSLAGEVVDWAQVVELATAILESRSKDVAAATYLTSGLFELEGYAGLAAGITLLADLHESFGDALFPRRPRGRVNALTWLAERLEGALERRPARAADADVAATCLEQLRRLDSLAAELYGDNAPALGPARRALEGMVRSLEEDAKRKEAPKPAAAAPAATAVPSSMSTPAELLKAFAAAAPMLKEADATDPLAHLLPRLAAWGGLAQLPPNEAGKSRVPAPQAATRQALTGLLEQGDWPGLIVACEQRLAVEPLWLDPQRWAVQALRKLGGGYAAAAVAVVAAVRLLLARLPGFQLITFADGTPFADGETRLWIDTEVLATAAPAAGGGGGGEAPPWEEAEQEARAKAAGGDLKGGLALLQDGVRAAASDHDRFHWRLAAARLCHTAGRTDLAVPLLEALDEEAEARDLSAWAPELARTVLASLVEAYKGAGKRRSTPEEVQRLEVLRARLCRLDVVAALDLGATR